LEKGGDICGVLMATDEPYKIEISEWKGLFDCGLELDVDPHYLAACQNVHFNDEGIITKRNGVTNVYSNTGKIYMIQNIECQQGYESSSFKNKTLVVAGSTLHVIFNSTWGTQQSFASSPTYHYVAIPNYAACFISNESGGAPPKMLFWNGSSFSYVSAALDAPASAPALAAGTSGTLSGTFLARTTYVDTFGNESNPSPAPSAGVVLDEENFNVYYTASSDPSVIYGCIYVLTPSGSNYQFVQTCSNVSQTVSVTFPISTIEQGDFIPTDNYTCPYGKYVRIFNDMLLVAGDPTLADLIYPSNFQFHRQFATQQDFARATDGDGRPIVGFGKNFETAIVGKTRSYHTAEGSDNTTFTTKPRCQIYGPVGQTAMNDIWGKFCFFSEEGIYLDDGLIPAEISANIRKWLMQLNAANLVFRPTHIYTLNDQYFKQLMFAVSSSGASENDTVLVYNYKRDAWTVWNGFTCTALGRVPDDYGYNWSYGGDDDGNVYKFQPPNTHVNSDNVTGSSTTSISMYAETPWMHLPKIKGIDNWDKMRTEPVYLDLYAGGEPASGHSTISIVTNFYTDFDKDTIRGTFTTTHSAANWPTITVDPKRITYGGTLGTFNWVKFKFSNNVLDEGVKIHKIVLAFRAKPGVR
jgi:hypothetical protein